jgi:hypothetical protein
MVVVEYDENIVDGTVHLCKWVEPNTIEKLIPWDEQTVRELEL